MIVVGRVIWNVKVVRVEVVLAVGVQGRTEDSPLLIFRRHCVLTARIAPDIVCTPQAIRVIRSLGLAETADLTCGGGLGVKVVLQRVGDDGDGGADALEDEDDHDENKQPDNEGPT